MHGQRVAIVWLWFGPPPVHSRLLFKSVAANTDIDVHLFTDQAGNWGNIPKNVFLHQTTLPELRYRIRSKLLPGAALSFAYKACDYRPAFGEIFAEELRPYDFWGWGDLDVIWGQIHDFVPDAAFKSCDKIFQFGALSFVRNSKKMNTLFQQPGGLDWADVTRSEPFRGFDETLGFYAKIEAAGCPRYYEFYMADIMPCRPWFTERVGKIGKPCLYSWVEGQAFREIWIKGGLQQTPVSYIHFQKREVPLASDPEEMATSFWITPNGFMKRPVRPTHEDFGNACTIQGSTYLAFTSYWLRRAMKRLFGTNIKKAVR